MEHEKAVNLIDTSIAMEDFFTKHSTNTILTPEEHDEIQSFLTSYQNLVASSQWMMATLAEERETIPFTNSVFFGFSFFIETFQLRHFLFLTIYENAIQTLSTVGEVLIQAKNSYSYRKKYLSQLIKKEYKYLTTPDTTDTHPGTTILVDSLKMSLYANSIHAHTKNLDVNEESMLETLYDTFTTWSLGRDTLLCDFPFIKLLKPARIYNLFKIDATQLVFKILQNKWYSNIYKGFISSVPQDILDFPFFHPITSTMNLTGEVVGARATITDSYYYNASAASMCAGVIVAKDIPISHEKSVDTSENVLSSDECKKLLETINPDIKLSGLNTYDFSVFSVIYNSVDSTDILRPVCLSLKDLCQYLTPETGKRIYKDTMLSALNSITKMYQFTLFAQRHETNGSRTELVYQRIISSFKIDIPANMEIFEPSSDSQLAKLASLTEKQLANVLVSVQLSNEILMKHNKDTKYMLPTDQYRAITDSLGRLILFHLKNIHNEHLKKGETRALLEYSYFYQLLNLEKVRKNRFFSSLETTLSYCVANNLYVKQYVIHKSCIELEFITE